MLAWKLTMNIKSGHIQYLGRRMCVFRYTLFTDRFTIILALKFEINHNGNIHCWNYQLLHDLDLNIAYHNI